MLEIIISQLLLKLIRMTFYRKIQTYSEQHEIEPIDGSNQVGIDEQSSK